MQSKSIFFILFFIITSHVSAQLKVGSNPKIISNNAYFDVESTNGNHIVFSKDSGKVGIGTVLPTNKLHIKDTISKNPLRIEGLLSGSTTSDSVLMINSTGVVKRNTPSAVVSAYEPWYNVATNSGATANTQNIYQLGKVGIGIANPFYKLHIVDSTTTTLGASNPIASFTSNTSQNNAIAITSNLAGSTLLGINGGSAIGELLMNSRYIASPANGSNIQLIDGAATTPKAYLTATAIGIGIGTVTPTNKLHIKDTINNNPLKIEGLLSGSTATDSILMISNGGIVKRNSPSVLASANEPWYSKSTSKGAISNTDTIYQMGYVGIGTNSPSATLTVDNSGTTGTASGAQALFRDNGAGNAIIGLQTKGVRVGWFGLDRNTSTMYWNNDGTGAGNALSNAKMVLTSAGNFGLGTTTPGGALTLYGSSSLALPSTIQGIANASKEIVFGKGGVTTGLAAIAAVDNGTFGGGLSFLTKASNSIDNFPTSAIQAMVIDWNGRVGIGTGNPNWLLDVQTNTNAATQTAQFVNVNSGTSAESHIGIGAGSGAWARLVGYNGTLGIRNYSTGTELMTIKTAGNIGIGTTSPGYPLHIKSSAATSLYVETTSGDPNGVVTINVPSSNTVCGAGQMNCSEFLMFQVGGTNIGNITPNGAGTATQYNTTSDFRLKENIASTHFSIADLMKMNVVDYNYKMDKNKNKEIGFVAQDLHKLIPSVVKVGTDELDEKGMPKSPWMVDYGKLTPIVIKAAQDLKKENDAQQILINTQAQKIEELMKRLEALEAKMK